MSARRLRDEPVSWHHAPILAFTLFGIVAAVQDLGSLWIWPLMALGAILALMQET